MNLVLIGFKSVGKSSLGQKLAKNLSWGFIDSDNLISEIYLCEGRGKYEISKIYRELGEKEFRSLEKEVLKECIGKKNHVISLGGGAPLSHSSSFDLHQLGRILYLYKKPENLLNQLQKYSTLSVLDPKNLDNSFKNLFATRDAIYRQICDDLVDITGLSDEKSLAILLKVALAR